MLAFRLTVSAACRRQLEQKLNIAQQMGKIEQVKPVLAILSLVEGATVQATAMIVKVSEEAVRQWLHLFLVKEVQGLTTNNPPGRRPQLTKAQKQELAQIIDDGPETAGFPVACWRWPMIHHLI
ncbi:MAG: hypothetical protein HY314_13745 [Acidobacteria bacterium]|nr:hypothetical protein [Acidobacteriota bacterium]